MNKKDLNEFIQKVQNSKKANALDLSSDEDLSIAIMNLVSIEEHFFFTAKKTGKDHYFDLMNEAREMRKDLLKKMIKDYEGEVWCISKHLLAASMRLYEVGTKKLSHGDKEEAYDLFEKSYNLYSIFWGLVLGAIDGKNIQKIEEGALNKSDETKNGFVQKLGQMVQKLVDCCRE